MESDSPNEAEGEPRHRYRSDSSQVPELKIKNVKPDGGLPEASRRVRMLRPAGEKGRSGTSSAGDDVPPNAHPPNARDNPNIDKPPDRADVDEGAAADRLALLLTKNQTVKNAFGALSAAEARLESGRASSRTGQARPELQRWRDDALKRYVGTLNDALASEQNDLAHGVADTAGLVESPDTPAPVMDFISKSLMLIGAAVLASVSAGALGALLVNEVVWKEVAKSALGAFIPSVATLAVERAWRNKHPRSG